MHRSFFVRLGLAVFAMLLLGLGVYAGLGWALWSRMQWTLKFDRERYDRLVFGYARMLGAINSKDSDGDGMTDGYEFFLHANLRNPRIHPTLNMLLDEGFIATHGFLYHYAAPLPEFTSPQFNLQPGDHRRVRIRVLVYGRPAPFAPTMRMLLTPTGPGVVALPNGTPSATPLLVPVAADGTLEFDLTVGPNADASDPSKKELITVSHPFSKKIAGEVSFGVGWRSAALPCTAEDVADDDPAARQATSRSNQRLLRLHWKPSDGSGMQVIETTRDESSEN